MLHFLRLCFVGLLITSLTACGGGSDDHPAQPTSNIVSLAGSDPRLSILVEAVTAADLASTLSGTGPFTVFAPTNDAFVSLLNELQLTKAQLLANKPLLTSVLTYHVLAGQVSKASVPVGKAITTLQGGFFKIDANGTGLQVTDGRNRNSNIVQTDLNASNGVVHVIDKVLLPADKNIVQTALALPDFSILAEAVVAANLQDALSGKGPFTVFAPTNAAFASLLSELSISKEALLANKPLLTSVLTYHVLNSNTLKADITPGAALTTLAGQTFSINANLFITDQRGRTAKITGTDVLTNNGVIHIIDKVIHFAPYFRLNPPK